MRARPRRGEAGYTLVELIVALTILATITGAITATFLTANNANANVSERIHESNDAQLTAGFWTADAEAAGGVDPTNGTTNPLLGVSKTDDGGCATGGGTLVFSFKWREWAGRDTMTAVDSFTTRVADYVYQPGTAALERRTCSDAATPGTLAPAGTVTLATRVGAPPTTSCDGAACPGATRGLPHTVTIGVTETNQPSTSSSGPYAFTLTATVRSDSQTTPDSTNAAGSPLLILAGTCTGGSGIDIGGSSDIVVNGDVVLNTTDGSGCTAMHFNGSGNTWDVGSTTIAGGGSCSGQCPAWSNGTAIGNPFASLAAPSTAGCNGGPNPVAVNGHYPPGTYPRTLTLSGTQVLDPGTFVLCNGLAGGSTTRSDGVFVYVAGGTITASTVLLSAPTSGTYAHIAMWNATTNDWDVHQDTVNIEGAYYSPRAGMINGNGNTSVTIGVLVVKFLDFSGSSDVTVTGTGTPGSPTLTATTSPAVLGQVDLTWAPPRFTGISAISSYELRINRGTGWGAWANVGLTQPVHDVCGSNPAIPTTCDYQIRAINAQGAGSPSNIATADSFADSTAPTVTVTAPTAGQNVGPVVTFAGTAGNATGDSPTVSVQLYAGPGCTPGTEIGAPITTTRTGTTWSVVSGTMTVGAKSVCASQSDWAGNVGTSAARNFSSGQVTNLAVANGGTNGRIDKGDTVTVTFAQAMNPGTLCAAWNGTTSRSTITVRVKNNDPATNGNDSLTVTDSACTFNFGTIDLGAATWVTADTTYSGNGNNASTAVMNAGLTTLTIKLGTPSATAASGIAAQTMTYTPNPAMRDSVGTAMTGSYTFPGLRF
ncbi:MAG: prepilin-type N-terminal cleavage/methylation domain-containing protein [Acidimicrobiia bacterium]